MGARLQELGPRFTLKLRSLQVGWPALPMNLSTSWQRTLLGSHDGLTLLFGRCKRQHSKHSWRCCLAGWHV